jgi:hypothetical protein
MNIVIPPLFDPGSQTLISFAFFLFVIKIMALVGFGIYIIFALVVFRQIFLMARTVTTKLEPLLKIFGIAHLLFAISVWFYILITL